METLVIVEMPQGFAVGIVSSPMSQEITNMGAMGQCFLERSTR
jgi:hypothetical protein